MEASAARRARRLGALGALALCLAIAALIVAPWAGASSARAKPTHKPKIKAKEAGYFGNALTTHTVSVFVYTNLVRVPAST